MLFSRRALLYTVVEDLLTNFGMDGKACLLRAICEVHGHKAIHKFGFIGEFLQLFLTWVLQIPNNRFVKHKKSKKSSLTAPLSTVFFFFAKHLKRFTDETRYRIDTIKAIKTLCRNGSKQAMAGGARGRWKQCRDFKFSKGVEARLWTVPIYFWKISKKKKQSFF